MYAIDVTGMYARARRLARIPDRIWNVKIGTNEWYWKMYPAAAGYLVVFAVVSVEFPTELR